MKICTICKIEKADELFKLRGKNRSGRMARCKLCDREYDKVYYLKNKQKIDDKGKSKQLKTKIINKIKRQEYLSLNCCVDCGNNDIRVLDFDHRRDKKQTIARMVGSSRTTWNKIEEEIKKCDVRCANCHRIRHSKM